MNPLKFALVCLLPASLLLPSCKPEEPATPPTLKLSQTEISVPASGGPVSLDYSLDNAVEGSVISVEPVSEVDWVTDIDLSVADKISFNVAANEAEESREAEFTVSYPGLLEEVSFTVIQQASEPVPAPFEIIVKDVQTSSITFDIIALDKEMDYIFFISPAEYVANFPDDDGLFNDDMEYFDQQGIALENEVMRGDQLDYVHSPVLPETEFTCYAYGVDVATKTRLTDIVRVNVTSGEIQMIDVSLDVNLEISGAAVTMSVDPGSYEDWYYMNIIEGLDPEQVDMVQACYQFFYEDIALYVGLGMDPETILLVSCSQGETSETFNLEPEKEYVAIAFAVDGTPQLCSAPFYEVFQTEKVEPSDNQISFEISNLTAHTATLSIKPTNNDPYVWLHTGASTFTGYSDDEILDFVLTYYPIYSVFTGEQTQELTGLNSKTDYMVLAFGYSGGTVTTPLFKHTFTTPDEVVSDVDFSLVYDKWYSIAEVAELMPEYEFYVGGWDALLPVEVSADFDSIENYYYYLYDFSTIASMSDDDIKMDLMNNYSSSDPANVFIVSYGNKCVFAGFAIDKNGAYTKVWRSAPIELSEDNASYDAQEFVDWYNGAYGLSSAAFQEPQKVRVYKPGYQDK